VVAVAVAVVAAVGATIGVRSLLHEVNPPSPACRVGNGAESLLLDTEQAANATTITAVARRMKLPHHAVTIALATVLQESRMHNLPYGDRDSVGLFQQRPSQGWGTPAQLLTPSYAATAFYQHLAKVHGWQHLPVAEAAQDVQHSADGSGYEAWVEEARAIARALTGEVTAEFSCRFASGAQPAPARLVSLAGIELGRGMLRGAGDSADDWLVAQWLVGHSYQLGIRTVTVDGHRWRRDRHGRWPGRRRASGPCGSTRDEPRASRAPR
jgi:hypothetical protein